MINTVTLLAPLLTQALGRTKLMNRNFFFVALAALMALPAMSFAWTVNSRELVDVQFSGDDSLIILVSAPYASEPGIYRWPHDADAPTLLCGIASPTAFSFDRRTIIERVNGAEPELRLYTPSTCKLQQRIKLDGYALDADVYAGVVAVAVRARNQQNELRLYGALGSGHRAQPTALIGRNVEIGFAPDGRSVVNFDLSDGNNDAWRVPSLAPQPLPAWMTSGETTFVPGSPFVKRYDKDAVSVARWPGGQVIYSLPAAHGVRIRQLSATGRFGALHSIDALTAANQALDWVDFATQKRVRLATGSIDNAAIHAAGKRVAWALRHATDADQVAVEFAHINADGNAVLPPVDTRARQ